MQYGRYDSSAREQMQKLLVAVKPVKVSRRRGEKRVHFDVRAAALPGKVHVD